jgi:hypothetical protein
MISGWHRPGLPASLGKQKKAGFMEARLLGLFDVSNAYKR